VSEEKGTIEMCKTEMNHIAYSSDRLNGNAAFGTYADWAFKLRKDIDSEYKSEAKQYSSCLWGSMSEKNKKIKLFNNDELLDMDAYNFEQLIPTSKGGYFVRYCKKRKIFASAYGRLGCFLTSFCRLQLYKISTKLPFDIICINTDGMILKVIDRISALPKSIIGTEAGKFKIVDEGDVEIFSSNNYKFIT
jgi:hypothetical protein